jgi:CBS-domain-containing membrane protein
MQAHHLRHLVVVDGNHSIVGMLTQHDIVKRLEVEYIEQFIAERKETEKSLREAREQLARTVNVSAAAIYVVHLDPGGRQPPEVSFISENITRIPGHALE